MSNNYAIRTPHAAVIIWNYDDRIGADGVTSVNSVHETILSTVSCLSIETSKSKSEPAGRFQLVLSPFKNWVSTITSGSWCAILMSNKPITQAALQKADPSLVKMIGKIETVRVDTVMAADGARQTRYMVAGTDWGHVFNNILYIDNLLNVPNDPESQGTGAAIAIRNALLGNGNTPQSFAVKDNLRSLLNIFGSNLSGFTNVQGDINRLAKSTYDMIMPQAMVDFFNFAGPNSSKNKESVITRVLNLQTGKITTSGKYDNTVDSYGYLNPYSLQGTNTFWQILLDNSNPALNEMYNEIQWVNNRPALTIYNRIKPFSYKVYPNTDKRASGLRSMFTNVPTHDIDSVTVISVNAGTNWRDKYNFIEVKPLFTDFNIFANWTKHKTQIRDTIAFNREGFRPLIVGTKQFPGDPMKPGVVAFSADMLLVWVSLMREWYFDTHRLLNGTLVMTGTTEYIPVGDNIRFDAGLINPTPNINAATNAKKTNQYVLAHVESVAHTFTSTPDGARTYTTTIQFVRGIVVDQNNKLVGEGSLDKIDSKMTPSDNRNKVNTVTTSEVDDPDPQKIKGT